MSVFRRSGASLRPLLVLGLILLGLFWTTGMPSQPAQAGPELQGQLPLTAPVERDAQSEAQPDSEPEPSGIQGIDSLDAIGSVFMYQGRLARLDRAVDGSCDFRFRLFDADTEGNAVGSPNSDSLMVRDGRFNAVLDFGGGAFIGNPRWLAVEVRCPGDSEYIILEPRQMVAPAPYAQYADRAHWGGLVAVPEGFADGVDDGTDYAAGPGLSLVGSTLAISRTFRLPQDCSDGQVAKLSDAQQAWVCADEAGSDNAWQVGGNSGLSSESDFLGTLDAQPLRVRTNNVDRLYLSAAGALGIGTDEPVAQVHIQGAVAEDSGDVELRVENTDATGITEMSLINDAGTTLLMGLTGSGRVDGDTVGITASGTSTTTMKISNTSGSLRLRADVIDLATAGGAMRLAEDGKVGINTESPSELLEVVDGNIKVTNGDIIDAFLLSDAPASSLASGRPAVELAALREYLAAGGSPPRLPSFEQMARDGHSLAAYDLALRAQIEDLLLYLLEQEARLNALEAQRSSQASTLSAQAALLEAQARRLELLERQWTSVEARMQAMEQSWANASANSSDSSAPSLLATDADAKPGSGRSGPSGRSGAGAPAR
jgi:uncharacterized coiled-coil protein SlyX